MELQNYYNYFPNSIENLIKEYIYFPYLLNVHIQIQEAEIEDHNLENDREEYSLLTKEILEESLDKLLNHTILRKTKFDMILENILFLEEVKILESENKIIYQYGFTHNGLACFLKMEKLKGLSNIINSQIIYHGTSNNDTNSNNEKSSEYSDEYSEDDEYANWSEINLCTNKSNRRLEWINDNYQLKISISCNFTYHFGGR